MLLNAWELILIGTVVAMLIGIGRAMGWHRVVIKDRSAAALILALAGLIYVVQAFLK